MRSVSRITPALEHHEDATQYLGVGEGRRQPGPLSELPSVTDRRVGRLGRQLRRGLGGWATGTLGSAPASIATRVATLDG